MDDKPNTQATPEQGSLHPDGSVAVRAYLKARRKTIESSIGSEVLAGNKHKEECERTALAEITALEQWICKEGH